MTDSFLTDALIFIGVIGGLALLRVIAATWIFLWLLPEGVRCPHCDADTLPVASRGWNTLLPWFRTSWCTGCGWEGLLKRVPYVDAAKMRSHSGQLPLSSK